MVGKTAEKVFVNKKISPNRLGDIFFSRLLPFFKTKNQALAKQGFFCILARFLSY
jgi:hypothetical protein